MKRVVINKESLAKSLLVIFVIFSVVSLGIWLFVAGRSNGANQFYTVHNDNKSTEPIFTFSAVGDFGANDNTKKVLEESAETDFTLALGDYSYGEASSEEAWCDFVKQGVGETYPFMLVAGNHDVEGDNGFGQGHFERFAGCLPNRMPNMIGVYGKQYYFDYKKVARFIAISPNLELLGGKGDYSKGSSDYNWLSQTLDSAKSSNIDWIVLAMHENCITIGVKKCSIGEDILNLSIEKGVDLIFQGHEHGYMRSKQLTINEKCPAVTVANPNENCTIDGDNSNFKEGKGSVLVINGTGGYRLREIDLARPEKIYFANWHGSNIEPAHGPTQVKVFRDKLEVNYSTIDGKTTDSFSISR